MDKNLNPGKSAEESLYSNPPSLINSPDLNSTEKGELSRDGNQLVKGEESSPEINQLNGMLEKILDIQHPERMGNKLQQQSREKQAQVFPVCNPENISPVTLLENKVIKQKDSSGHKPGNGQKNSFYGLTDNNPSEFQEQNTLKATIHESQTIVSGSVVKLRTLNDMYINGILIPRMHFIYGMANLNDERLKIEIKSIRYKDNILPVNLSVYDLDGMEGIFIPGAIARNSSKESTDKALQSIALNSLDPSVGTQAASVGIEAAKSFLSKKVKLIKVSLKPGYQVLLKENRNQ
jgi:conjugative transposon TraM protein